MSPETGQYDSSVQYLFLYHCTTNIEISGLQNDPISGIDVPEAVLFDKNRSMILTIYNQQLPWM